MDHLTNFSLIYTEFEDETFYSDSYSDDVINNGKLACEITPENSFTILSPMMFSRQSSLDSMPTPSWDGCSVQSDYSCYISSSVSPSDIPDSPSEMMPQPSQVESERIKDNSSPVDDDERDNNLLKSCLQLGIYSMHHPDNNDNRQSVESREDTILSEDEGSDSLDNEKKLLEKCWQNGIEAVKIRKR